MEVNIFFSGFRQEACSGLLPPGLITAEHVHGAVPLGEGLGHAVADAGVGPRHASDLTVHVLRVVGKKQYRDGPKNVEYGGIPCCIFVSARNRGGGGGYREFGWFVRKNQGIYSEGF